MSKELINPFYKKILCRVRKFFRPAVLPNSMVKLTNAKIKWIVKHVENGDITTRQADTYNVSIRRVQQLVKEYRDKGRVPVLST